MAQSLETLRNNIVTHIYGRRLGLAQDETLIGSKDIKRAVQDLTSASTATAANNYGLVVARISGSMTTATANFLLSNPIPGVAVDIVYAGTSQGATAGSTGIAFSRPTTAFYIQSSVGTTGVAVLIANGGSARLLGISTDAYALQSGSIAATVTGTS